MCGIHMKYVIHNLNGFFNELLCKCYSIFFIKISKRLQCVIVIMGQENNNSTKIYVVGTQKNRLSERVLLIIQNE